MVDVLHNIEVLLKEKNMSWYQLSRKADIPEGSLWDYRHHRKKDITLTVAIKIAKTLEISLDELACQVLSKK